MGVKKTFACNYGEDKILYFYGSLHRICSMIDFIKYSTHLPEMHIFKNEFLIYKLVLKKKKEIRNLMIIGVIFI